MKDLKVLNFKKFEKKFHVFTIHSTIYLYQIRKAEFLYFFF